jgi:hypothetical protein
VLRNEIEYEENGGKTKPANFHAANGHNSVGVGCYDATGCNMVKQNIVLKGGNLTQLTSTQRWNCGATTLPHEIKHES